MTNRMTAFAALLVVLLCACGGATQAAPKDVTAPPASATRTESGLVYRVLTRGTGTERPGPMTVVDIHYNAWTTDGKLFDSSIRRGKPVTARVDGVIAGLTEALQLMTAGDKFRLWIPRHLGFHGGADKPLGTLVFDVELLSLQ